MGLNISEPVTTKETDFVESSNFLCGSSCMQGWRVTMEDAHVHLLEIPPLLDVSFFSLYDGHGGQDVALIASKNFHNILFNHRNLYDGNIAKAFRESFLQMDAELRSQVPNNVGSTANVILIVRNKMFCSNIGDSRTVVSIGGIARDLSEDHKPQANKELQRIVQAGGYVTNYRVNGGLALSRAFGDFMYKDKATLPPEKQMVIAVPDVTVLPITSEFEFFVTACDGIWDVMTSQEVVNFVRLRIGVKMHPKIICEELLTNCLAPDIKMGGLGCDNMTVIICCFLKGRSFRELVKICSTPVAYHTVTPYPLAPTLHEGATTQHAIFYSETV